MEISTELLKSSFTSSLCFSLFKFWSFILKSFLWISAEDIYYNIKLNNQKITLNSHFKCKSFLQFYRRNKQKISKKKAIISKHQTGNVKKCFREIFLMFLSCPISMTYNKIVSQIHDLLIDCPKWWTYISWMSVQFVWVFELL